MEDMQLVEEDGQLAGVVKNLDKEDIDHVDGWVEPEGAMGVEG